ncbi:hypothetical protein AgCh_031673 [Apium graveolens]
MLLNIFAQWGIDRIFTLTLDNTSSNDKAISHLKKFLRELDVILENKFLHLRYWAHILNLVANDGLKEQHDPIARIRTTTRYVRSSPTRLEKFMKCVERENIKCKKIVCLDTRWNSTYTMLEVAVKYDGAFIRMVIEDNDFEAFFKANDLEILENSKKKKKKVVEDDVKCVGKSFEFLNIDD